MISKKSILFSALLATQVASAGVYKCNVGDVSTPCGNQGWRLGGDALWVQPNGNLENVFGSGAQTWNHPLNWGFRIEGAYQFSYSNDINVNWAYFKKSAAIIDTSPVILNTRLQSIDSTPMVSVVNIELAQHVDFGQNWNVRLHAGLQIDELSSELLATNGARDSLLFSLVGPRAGVDTSYVLDYGFAIYTNAALGALYGTSRIVGGPNGAWANFGNRNPSGQTLNGNYIAVDYNIGMTYTSSSDYGDWVWRVGWLNYTWANGTQYNLPRPIPSLNGMLFGLKWIGT